jgi:2-dehydro-3-deoxyphosphooctonate aldolase (KDO 8-P synthase)
VEKDGSWLADFAKELAEELPPIDQFILKASFDKSNRTEHTSFRGIGFEKALHALYLASRAGFRTTTDIHEPHQAARVAEVVDVIQIPQALCSQLDLITAAGATGRIVNVKIGVAVSVAKMLAIADTVESAGAKEVWWTYRGTMFGNELVFDVARLWHFQSLGLRTFADITHSAQTTDRTVTGGRRGLSAVYAKAAHAVSRDNSVAGTCIFAECHPNPEQALSDSATQLTPRQLATILRELP